MLYDLEITTITPLHIGAGGSPLRRNVDFITAGRFTYVLNQERVLDYLLPTDGDPAIAEKIATTFNLGSFIGERDLRQHPELAQYRLGGRPHGDELRPQLKDVYGRPYLPGSTLKGALRTALGTALARELRLSLAQLGPRREWAAREVEGRIFSSAPRPQQTPNYDLLRAIQVGDSAPVDPAQLDLVNAIVWPAGRGAIPINVEALREETTLRARLKLDRFLLDTYAEDLRWDAAGRRALRDWIAICREHGLARIEQEARFFAGRAPAMERFYADLLRKATEAAPDTFYAQIGWGGGWHSKTLSRIITPNRDLLRAIIQRYRLTRGRDQGNGPFPKTRRVVSNDGQHPSQPLGWVQIRVQARG